MSQSPAPYITKDIMQRAADQWKQADGKRWYVASVAFRIVGKTKKHKAETEKLAAMINRSPDTVERLAAAYTLFLWMMVDEYKRKSNSAPVRILRRQIPYTRWAIVYRAWEEHEFSLDEAREYLVDFKGGNDALSSELENRYGAPEWQRRIYSIYKEAWKLRDDLDVPDALKDAALNYCDEYNAWVKEQK